MNGGEIGLVNEIRLGSINGSHGIKGWVKVFSYTDPIEAIIDYSPWTLRRGGQEKEVEIVDFHAQGKRIVVELAGLSDRDEADLLIGYDIYIDRGRLPPLEEGEYYWFQLEGLKVRNEAGKLFGKVDHLLETGANDVLVVEATQDSIDDRQRLIPFVEGTIVRKVDQATGEISVVWDADY